MTKLIHKHFQAWVVQHLQGWMEEIVLDDSSTCHM